VGERWHYAPMATRLAQAGIVTAVVSYTLYPQALVPEMVAEVSRSLTWMLDSIAGYGGKPTDVTLAGHSAGAQLCAMALIQRAAAAEHLQGNGLAGDGNRLQEDEGAFRDDRMPCRFVGMAGVYDIAEHFEYEKGGSNQLPEFIFFSASSRTNASGHTQVDRFMSYRQWHVLWGVPLGSRILRLA
jgi:hypothetical protein